MHDDDPDLPDTEQARGTPPANHVHSLTRVRTILAHPAADQHQLSLLMAVEIHCTLCEFKMLFHVPGHHLKAVVLGFQQAIDQYPELTKEHVIELPKDVTYHDPGQPSGKAS